MTQYMRVYNTYRIRKYGGKVLIWRFGVKGTSVLNAKLKSANYVQMDLPNITFAKIFPLYGIINMYMYTQRIRHHLLLQEYRKAIAAIQLQCIVHHIHVVM